MGWKAESAVWFNRVAMACIRRKAKRIVRDFKIGRQAVVVYLF